MFISHCCKIRLKSAVSSGRHLRLRESLREAEGILLRRNEHIDAVVTWANERWHDLEMGTLFAFDETWANRAWGDLDLFATIDSNDMASNTLQAVQNLTSPREKFSECGVHLVIPESEWDHHGMQSLGLERWRNRVQDVD